MDLPVPIDPCDPASPAPGQTTEERVIAQTVGEVSSMCFQKTTFLVEKSDFVVSVRDDDPAVLKAKASDDTRQEVFWSACYHSDAELGHGAQGPWH